MDDYDDTEDWVDADRAIVALALACTGVGLVALSLLVWWLL